MAESSEFPLSTTRRWAITVTVMLVSVLQILDTSATNFRLLAFVYASLALLIPFTRPVRLEPAHRPAGEAVAPLPAPTE